jgi:hypothetical protein
MLGVVQRFGKHCSSTRLNLESRSYTLNAIREKLRTNIFSVVYMVYLVAAAYDYCAVSEIEPSLPWCFNSIPFPKDI